MLDADRIRRQLADFALEPLFIEELGWDRYSAELEIVVDGQSYVLRGFAEKRGMVAVQHRGSTTACPTTPRAGRSSAQAARSVHEHLIIYTDGEHTTQVWQWVRREPGGPTATPRARLPPRPDRRGA